MSTCFRNARRTQPAVSSMGQSQGGGWWFYLPAGGTRARFMDGFALCWIGATAAFNVLWLRGEGEFDAPIYVNILLALFWLVGLLTGFIWLKMRFTRTIVLVDAGRLVVTRSVLGIRTTTEIPLSARSARFLGRGWSHAVLQRRVNFT